MRLFLVFSMALNAAFVGCAQKAQVLERADGTYNVVALGPTERDALKLAVGKATAHCKARDSRFALIDRRTSQHGAASSAEKSGAGGARKPAAANAEYRVELVFACK
jgi:hypothetical protein